MMTFAIVQVEVAPSGEYDFFMEDWVDLDEAQLMHLARSIERDCQEHVKWERLKLEWILENKATPPAHSRPAL